MGYERTVIVFLGIIAILLAHILTATEKNKQWDEYLELVAIFAPLIITIISTVLVGLFLWNTWTG